jgi:hypothetical protein
MFTKSVHKCLIVIILIQDTFVRCNSQTVNHQTTSHGLEVNASLIRSRQISEENVTLSDNFSSDKEQNKEFPPSAIRKKTIGNDNYYDYYDYYEISAASNDAKDLPECILSRSELYLAWWVFENGSLKLPASNRSGSSVGFADLSVRFNSESSIFNHISELTAANPNDVR